MQYQYSIVILYVCYYLCIDGQYDSVARCWAAHALEHQDGREDGDGGADDLSSTILYDSAV